MNYRNEDTMKVRLSKLSLISLFCYITLSLLLLIYVRENVREKVKELRQSEFKKLSKKKEVGDKYDDIKKLPQNEVEDKQVIYTTSEKKIKKPFKSILIYSTLFGLEYWPTLSLKEIKTFMNRCDVTECSITYDKEKISSADAVLFHGVDVKNNKQYAPSILRNVSTQRRRDQKWVFFIQESPDNYNDFSEYEGLFNWLMSYKYTSDIQNPYGHFKPLDPWDPIPSKTVNYAQNKDKVGVWFISNCGHPRDNFMKELKRYVPITVGGKCAMKIFNKEEKCDQGSADCITLIKRHKFIFAFENSFCDYYVSEKYWNKGIDLGLVPVVMGARYDNYNVIPGSYIDASKFKSIEQLGSYLNYLDHNDTAYNEYFSWKRKYKRIGYEKMCELCKALHENRYARRYKDIWSSKEDCAPFEWKKEMMKHMSEISRRKS